MHGTLLKALETLKGEYARLRRGKESLLRMIEETELPESVYNSNAIENSMLSLDDTEKILLHQEIPGHRSKREVFEAENLAAVTTYLTQKAAKQTPLTEALLCLVHGTLLRNIHDDCAGSYRKKGEHVRVGTHIAPAPEEISSLMQSLMHAFDQPDTHILTRIVHFHLEFERVHPFLDGNGRTGRAFLNFQLQSSGYPPVIVPNKGKHSDYYPCFVDYEYDGSTKPFERLLAALLKESFHKRIAYLRGDDIVTLSAIRKECPHHSPQSLATLAKKQSLPAFRERGRWKVGRKGFACWEEGHEHR